MISGVQLKRIARHCAPAVASVVVLMSGVTQVRACRCGRPSLPQAQRSADAVFAGVATSTTTPSSLRGDVPVEFIVSEVWKGPVEPRITVYNWWTCEQTFEQGREYLVFAKRWEGFSPPGRLRTNQCDRTNLLAAVGKDVALLGVGSKPGRASPQRPVGRLATISMAVAVGAIILAGAGIRAVLRWRRSGRV
jgi:hypothetical protein